jgi:hypothetical protein
MANEPLAKSMLARFLDLLSLASSCYLSSKSRFSPLAFLPLFPILLIQVPLELYIGWRGKREQGRSISPGWPLKIRQSSLSHDPPIRDTQGAAARFLNVSRRTVTVYASASASPGSKMAEFSSFRAFSPVSASEVGATPLCALPLSNSTKSALPRSRHRQSPAPCD